MPPSDVGSPVAAAVRERADGTPSAVMSDPRARRRLGDLLVAAGAISGEQLQQGLAASAPGERLGQVLLRLGHVDEEAVADAVARQLGLPRVDLEVERPTEEAVGLVPARLAERHDIVPLRLEGDLLVIATADPSDVAAMDDVRLTAGARKVRPVIATASAIEVARRRVYRSDTARDLMQAPAEVQVPAPVDDGDLRDDMDGDAQPIVKLVSALLADAVVARASDIHIEPDRDGLAIRFRIDGLLRERGHVSRSMAGQVVSRLKIMSRLDIAERRLPQDGRATVRVDGQEVDLRVSTMPTMHGETVVLRLLPKGAERVTISELGLSTPAQRQFLEALERPQGLVLVTGPTGSGKTTTLYAGLEAVADPTRNVLTLEDPVEGELPGVNQTQIEPKIGFTFARGLRHVLRQDPDVVLIGEIRDRETAALAVEASFTGHLVLATLHTSDAPSSVARLVDLGADRFLVASSLLLVVAQRLARRLCAACKRPVAPDPTVAQRAGLATELPASTSFWQAAGCPHCDGTGALGRVAISETLPMTPAMRDLVMDGASESALTSLAVRDGMKRLREDAVERARMGDIGLDEAIRITPDA